MKCSRYSAQMKCSNKCSNMQSVQHENENSTTVRRWVLHENEYSTHTMRLATHHEDSARRSTWQVPLKALPLQNPPNREIQILLCRFKLDQNLNLNSDCEIPRNLSFPIWWISGIQNGQVLYSFLRHFLREVLLVARKWVEHFADCFHCEECQGYSRVMQGVWAGW